MPNKGDIERRAQIEIIRKDGMLGPIKELAEKFNVTERTILRDLAYLRSIDTNWITEVVDETLISLYKETFNGYLYDIAQITQVINDSSLKARDKEVKANLIKLRSEMRKDRLALLMEGPVVWHLQRLKKSNQILNVTKDQPKAIFGEIQKNTHIDIEQTPTTEYKPPTIESSESEE